MSNTEAPIQPAPQDETLLEALASICTVLVVGLFVITFVFQNFVPLVHYREPKLGDIIVFLKPHPESPDLVLVKRVVGLPGDHLYLRGGILYRNGVRQNEPQISMPTDNYDPYRDDFPSVSTDTDSNVTAEWAEELPHHIVNGELVVPPGVVFAMGDNRTESLDGRFWGFVPRENIMGRPLFNYWSFVTSDEQMYKTTISDRISFAFHVITHFFADTRWSRTFHLIK